MRDKRTTVAIVLSVLAICISVAAIVLGLTLRMSGVSADTKAGDVQYVLYLGINDKDTDEPVFTHEEAKIVLQEILARRMGGYTLQEAEGGWIGDDKEEHQGYTLVISLSDTTIEKVHALCDELLERFDQSSILIQTNRTVTEFYSKAL